MNHCLHADQWWCELCEELVLSRVASTMGITDEMLEADVRFTDGTWDWDFMDADDTYICPGCWQGVRRVITVFD